MFYCLSFISSFFIYSFMVVVVVDDNHNYSYKEYRRKITLKWPVENKTQPLTLSHFQGNSI